MRPKHLDRTKFAAPPKRAVAGGALIAIAALGIFSAHRASGSEPSSRFVVAVHEIPAGTTLQREDLGSIAIDVPEGVSAIDAEDATKLIGRVSAGRIAALEMVSEQDFLPKNHFRRPGSVRLALDLPASRAMQGVVAAGDAVSVLSTDSTGSGTAVLTTDAMVESIETSGRESIGMSGSVRVVLSVTGSELAAEIVDAAVRSDVSLVVAVPDAGETSAESGPRQ